MNIVLIITKFMFSFSLFLNALLFIPQGLNILRTHSAKNLSLLTFAGFNIIQFFVALHGLITKDYLLMFGYFISLCTCGFVTILIICYKSANKRA